MQQVIKINEAANDENGLEARSRALNREIRAHILVNKDDLKIIQHEMEQFSAGLSVVQSIKLFQIKKNRDYAKPVVKTI